MPDGCALLPRGSFFSPRWPAIHRKRRAIIGIEQPASAKEGKRGPRAPSLALSLG